MNFFYFFDRVAVKILLSLIRLYQKTISPDSGWFKDKYPVGYCKFQPHCSEYAYQAIAKYGSIKGTAKAIWRLLRCHPWSKGGPDPVK